MRSSLRFALVAGTLTFAAAPAALAAPGPPSSSFSTSDRGVAAYSSLLEEFGFDVEGLRTSLAETDLDESWTLVVLDPPDLDGDEVIALRGFLQDGGHLVTGGADPAWLDDLVAAPPTWRSGGTTSFSVPVSNVPGVTTVQTAGEGTWSDPGGGAVLAGSPTDALAVRLGVGAGMVTLLADVSPLQNRLLDRADNAGFALSLVGDAPVVFVESVHGYGPPRGLSAIPARWRWAGAGFVLATALWMWARGRRLGPPEQPNRVLPPPRRAYVEALAATLARARRP